VPERGGGRKSRTERAFRDDRMECSKKQTGPGIEREKPFYRQLITGRVSNQGRRKEDGPRNGGRRMRSRGLQSNPTSKAIRKFHEVSLWRQPYTAGQRYQVKIFSGKGVMTKPSEGKNGMKIAMVALGKRPRLRPKG